MFTQIYSIQTVEEALLCIEANADAIGIACNVEGLQIPAGISIEEGKRIFEAIGERAWKVALTVADNEADIWPLVSALPMDVLHVCGNHYIATPSFVKELKARYPQLRLLQAIPMVDETAFDLAVSLSEYCDFLILDSVAPGIDGVGAAGITHDWAISKRIVDALADSPCKVILAGGLGPDNVIDAIRTVKPWGVDSFTKTSVPIGNGKSRKDAELVRRFIENAKKFSEEK